MTKLKTDAESLQSCVSVSVTEFRIGNFVKDEILWDCEIESIFKQGQIEVSVKNVALDGKIGKRFFILNTDIIKPIPLTEEWLLKFGFETSNRIDLGELKPCYVIFSLALMIRHNSFFIDWIGGNTELKYVHQLQNIYFALTGSELQIGNLTEH